MARGRAPIGRAGPTCDGATEPTESTAEPAPYIEDGATVEVDTEFSVVPVGDRAQFLGLFGPVDPAWSPEFGCILDRDPLGETEVDREGGRVRHLDGGPTRSDVLVEVEYALEYGPTAYIVSLGLVPRLQRHLRRLPGDRLGTSYPAHDIEGIPL